MFETIGNLFTTGFWIVAIFLFVGSIIMCIARLVSGSGWEKFWAILGAVLGVVAFIKMYDWTEHIAWCMMATGIVCGFITALPDPEPPQKEKEPGLLGQIANQIIEDEHDIAKMEEAIRRSRK